MEKSVIEQANKLTTSDWHPPVQQRAGQNRIAVHPLQCSRASESQTKIHARSRTSFIRLLFHLTTAIFPFLHRCVRIHNFLSGVQSLCSAVPPISAVRCHWLGVTHILHAQSCREQVQSQPKHQNTDRGQCVCMHSHHHTFRKLLLTPLLSTIGTM